MFRAHLPSLPRPFAFNPCPGYKLNPHASQKSEPQQSYRAHVAVVDSEASPQASSNQDTKNYVATCLVGFTPEVELQVGWWLTTWRKRPRVPTEPRKRLKDKCCSYFLGPEPPGVWSVVVNQ